jgi:Trypsin-like peptidase domain
LSALVALVIKGGIMAKRLDESEYRTLFVSELEQSFGDFRSRPVGAWVKPLLAAASAVARIDNKFGDSGTGFVCKARDLGLPFDGYVLVTCNHVVCDPEIPGATPGSPQSRHPDHMTVTFEMRGPQQYRCKVIWQSPVDKLDVTVLRLLPGLPVSIADGAPFLPLATREPQLWINLPRGGRRHQRLFALHHPGGRKLALSFEDNDFTDMHPRPGTLVPNLIYYRTPTEYGSSGAPILSEALEVVAMHRAGMETARGGEKGAKAVSTENEGVSIQSIRAAITAAYPKRTFWRRLLERA